MKLKLPDKRTVGLFVRLSPKNKAYVEQLAAKLGVSITVVVDTMISQMRESDESEQSPEPAPN